MITGPGISTLMACIGEDNDRLYASIIESVDSYAIQDGQLILFSNGEQVLTLTQASNQSTNVISQSNDGTLNPEGTFVTEVITP